MATNIVITEKPSASTKIARALSGKKLNKKKRRRAYWYEFEKGGDKFFILPAVGHIFALDTKKDGGGWSYPVFDTKWIPSFEKKGAEFSRKYYKNMEDVVSKYIESANFIIATDYDTEGSVIGYNILKFLAGREDAERMKFSTLTKDEIVESFKNRSKHIDIGQVESGLTRHYLDFYWGINLTRALTISLKKGDYKGFTVLSTGRVQGPALSLLLEREMEIRNFDPVPFWQIEALVKKEKEELTAEYEKDKIWEKEDAEKIHNECDKDGTKATVKKISRRKYKQSPPFPFNTTDLQSEAYSQFKYSPRQTLKIAESLYQAGYISYPRSSSQKLPPSINYRKILRALSKLRKYSKLTKELLKKKMLSPNEGKKKDPAHPAIYPTFEPPSPSKLNGSQKRIYDLIVRRFLSVFADPATRESIKVDLDIESHNFKLSGKRTIKPGWTKFYGKYTKMKDQILPELNKGEELDVKKVELLEKETQPPGHYSQGSILKEMEKRGLGTRATRAEILQTLYNRKYVKGKSIEVTKLGETVANVLKEYAPKILSEKLTKKFEKEMESVYRKEKRRDDVLKEAKKLLEKILNNFKDNEKEIGGKLLEGLIESRKERYSMGPCPNCGEELRMIKSKSSGKRFVGCSNYPDCKTSFPLPQKGYISKTGKKCKDCGMTVIKVKRKGKRPYYMCINHKCKSKDDWGKKKSKK